MTTAERDASRNGKTVSNGNGAKTIQMVVQVAVAVLLPGVGFLASQVITNGQSIIALNERSGTVKEAVAGAATQDEVTRAIASVEKQQAIRDAGIQRELREIKDELKELRKARLEKPR